MSSNNTTAESNTSPNTQKSATPESASSSSQCKDATHVNSQNKPVANSDDLHGSFHKHLEGLIGKDKSIGGAMDANKTMYKQADACPRCKTLGYMGGCSSCGCGMGLGL